MRTVRVCCFCDMWENGGIESFLKNVLCRMDLRQTQVDIVAGSIRPSVFRDELAAAGVRFIELSGRKAGFLTNYRRFADLMREEHYDAVHLNLFQGLSLVYLRAAKRAGVPVRIAHSHNTALRKSPVRWLKMLLHNVGKRIFSGYATQLWACSKPAAEFLFPESLLREKGWKFIPNGIETERFAFDPAAREEVRRELGIDDRFVVGHVGRFCHQKNQEFLLEVFAEVCRRRQDSVLLLVGSGETEQQLKEQAERAGIGSRVIFYGSSDRVERLLWAMDAFVFPSRFEAFGIVAAEAQAAGLPVFCSEHIPPEAYITDQMEGIALSLGADAWAERVAAAQTTEDRAASARKIRAAGFDVNDAAERIRDAYLAEEHA